MKNVYWLCVAGMVALSGCVTTPKTPTERLANVRELVGPGNHGQVTDYLYRDSLQFRDVQQLGGTLVKQGKLPGSSVAVDEKSATLNIGTPLMKAVMPKLRWPKYWLTERRRFTAQGTIKGESADGLVSLFKNFGERRGYQKTLSFGLTGNWFIFGLSSTGTFYHYFPSDQATLHQSLREKLAGYDAGSNAPSAAQLAAAQILSNQVGNARGVFSPATLAAMSGIKPKKNSKQIPIGNLLKACTAADADAYTNAVRALRPLLPDDWDSRDQADAMKWVTDSLPSPVTLAHTPAAPAISQLLTEANILVNLVVNKQGVFATTFPGAPQPVDLTNDPIATLVKACTVADAATYTKAVQTLRPLLPAKWDTFQQGQAVAWVTTNLMAPMQPVLALLLHDQRLKRVTTSLDSLQMAAKWSKTGLMWVSATGSFNAQEQPIYNPADPLKPKQSPFNYWEYRLSYNWAILFRPVRFFVGTGLGFNNKATFTASEQVEYQQLTALPNTPGGTIEKSTYYPTAHNQPWIGQWNTQLSAYFPKFHFGLDGTSKIKLVKEGQVSHHNKYTWTGGIFFPVSAGETVVNLMPQVQYASSDGYSVGVSLSASVPGWLTKKPKK